VAGRAAPDSPARQPDLQVASRRLTFHPEHVQGGSARPGGIVLVGQRRAEDGVKVSALVPNREREKVAAVAVDHPLGPGHEVVEELRRVGVVVVVNAAEAHEHDHRRSQLGEEIAATRPHALVYRRQQPLAHDRAREGRIRGGWRQWPDRHAKAAHDTDPTARLAPDHDGLGTVLDRGEGRCLDHDVASLGVVLGRRQTVH
jgi:hypothetical protein